jgi:hypothetical protein
VIPAATAAAPIGLPPFAPCSATAPDTPVPRCTFRSERTGRSMVETAIEQHLPLKRFAVLKAAEARESASGGVMTIHCRLPTSSSQERHAASLLAQIETEAEARRIEMEMTMKMSKYAGSTFVKIDDLAAGPQRKTIESIEDGQFDKAVATFTDGSKLSLNTTNVRTLIRTFGDDSRACLGEAIELYLGTTRYQGADHTSVLVKPLLSPAAATTAKGEPQPGHSDIDDEIPF